PVRRSVAPHSHLARRHPECGNRTDAEDGEGLAFASAPADCPRVVCGQVGGLVCWSTPAGAPVTVLWPCAGPRPGLGVHPRRVGGVVGPAWLAGWRTR